MTQCCNAAAAMLVLLVLLVLLRGIVQCFRPKEMAEGDGQGVGVRRAACGVRVRGTVRGGGVAQGEGGADGPVGAEGGLRESRVRGMEMLRDMLQTMACGLLSQLVACGLWLVAC